MSTIGDFNQRVTVQQNSGSGDGYGGTQITWSNIPRSPIMFANVKPVRQSESERQGAERASRMYLFTVFRREDITESMRLVWQESATSQQICNIREVRRGPTRDLTMTIVAEAGVTQ